MKSIHKIVYLIFLTVEEPKGNFLKHLNRAI